MWLAAISFLLITEPMMIKGDTRIQAYDHVVVFCLDTAMRKLEDYFN